MSDEPLVPLRKASGGATVAGHHWPHDGAVVQVPYDLATELLAIHGGGFTVAEDEPPHGEPNPDWPEPGENAEEGREITEPAPAAKHPVTEPAPARPAAHATRPAAKPAAKPATRPAARRGAGNGAHRR